MVLLAAGVGHGLGDGDEFDEAGCSVAQQPGGSCHGSPSDQAREGGDENLSGAGGGSGGGCGGDGPPDRQEDEVLAVVRRVEAAIQRIEGKAEAVLIIWWQQPNR